MDEPLGYLEIARADGVVFARVIGLGVASVGLDFWDFSEEMVQCGFRRFIVDLTRCRSMDSTFMGVLVGIAEAPELDSEGPVVVVNPNEHHLKLMDGLGLSKIITILPERKPLPDMEMKRLDSFPRSSEERMRRIRDVHAKLVVLDQRNEGKFSAFLKMVDQELSSHNPM